MKYFVMLCLLVIPLTPAAAQYDYGGDQDAYINKRFDNPYSDYGRADPLGDDPYESTYNDPFEKPERGVYFEEKQRKEDKIKTIAPKTRDDLGYVNRNRSRPPSVSEIMRRGFETVD